MSEGGTSVGRPRRGAAALARVGAALVAILAVSCGGEEPPAGRPGPPNRSLLLITVDTLRADHLSCYGYRKIQTTANDALAARGILYRKAISPAPWTCPAVASLFTSLHPEAHGMVFHPIRNPEDFRGLSDELTTIAELLQEAGWDTHALSEQAWFSEAFGFSQGFDTFRVLEEDSRVITDEALGLIEDLPPDRPFFLYLHYIDPHSPYLPPPEFELDHPGRERYGLRDLPRDQWWKTLWETARERPDLEEYLAYVVSLYDGEILFVDHEIGRLLEGLERRGLAASTAVALVSDHGEAFGEHAMLHGSTLYNEELAVPLIIAVPWEPALQGVVHQEPVSTLSLMPTLLEVLGLPPPPSIHGRSLLPGSSSGPRRGRFVFSANAYDLDLKKVQTDRFSLLLDRESGRVAFYDLDRDPTEQRSAIERLPEEFQRHQRAMQRMLERESRWEKPPGEAVEMSEELEERLRQLGYVR